MEPLNFLLSCLLIITFQLHILPTNSQQEYVNNLQLDCNNNYNVTNGFRCNAPNPNCPAYVTFRSTPTYSTAPNIAFLLNSDPSAIAELNHVSDVDTIPDGRLLVIPVNCNCTTTGHNRTRRANGPRYYQHNASYRLKTKDETYFTMANNTYQGLTTCQAMMGQNPYMANNLTIGESFNVPIMCACPTEAQARKYSAQYLVSYLVTWGDDISKIAQTFGADMKSVLEANDLKQDDIIYPFTPILVPLKSKPTKLNIALPPPAQTPQSNPTPTPNGGGGGGSNRRGVYIGVGIGAGVVILSVAYALFWICRKPTPREPVPITPSVVKGEKKNPESTVYTPLPGSHSSSQNTISSQSADMEGFRIAIGSLTAYKFSELEEATQKFRDTNRIKGSVFRANFKGDNAAIKILKGHVPTDEINLLKHINHANIIRLSGYCIHKGNTYLVYEYAEKGSLDDFLYHQQKHHSEVDSLSSLVLGWKQRVQIASNVADALNYLHSYVNPPYVHKNLKSSNVLLDASYRAKVTNFGLARTIQEADESGVVHMTKHVVGTHGYLAPEYIENGVVTAKLDVFAFGVVVLELLSGKPAVRTSEENKGSSDDLLFVAIRKVFEGDDVREKLIGFMDSNLGRAYPLDLAYTMAQLAHKCVYHDMNSRPSMSEASMTLSKIYSSSLDWDPSDELANSSSLSHSR